MRIDTPHAKPTTTFLFQNSTKIVHFFNFSKKKQFLREFSLLRLITYVLRVPGVWNLLRVLTPLMPDRLPHFCFKILRKLFIFFNFFKKNKFLFDKTGLIKSGKKMLGWVEVFFFFFFQTLGKKFDVKKLNFDFFLNSVSDCPQSDVIR